VGKGRNVEHEVKLGAPDAFELPDLSDIAPIGSDHEELLDATYWDTPDLALIRSGATLRHRHPGDPQRGEWTAKVPEPSDPESAGMLRLEVSQAGGPGDGPPVDVVDVVRERLGGGGLAPVARLVSRRRVVRLGGLEVADDRVEVVDAGRSFRELEVEVVGPGGDALLAAVVDRLRAAGAGAADPRPKLAQALDIP
jgi:hypothetical protein